MAKRKEIKFRDRAGDLVGCQNRMKFYIFKDKELATTCAPAHSVAVYTMNGELLVSTGGRKYFHLDGAVEFCQKIAAGEIDPEQRQSTNAEIANSLINTFAPLVLDAIMMVFYLVVMIRYSLPLTCIGILSIVVNLVMSRVISKKRVNITRVQMRDAGKLAGATVAGVEMIETIKASGAENGYFEKWSGYQASVNTQEVRFAKLNQYLGMVPGLVSSLCNIAVLMLGVYLTMQGRFTVGMIMAFQGFLASFSAPATSLIGAGQTLQEMRTQMERIP